MVTCRKYRTVHFINCGQSTCGLICKTVKYKKIINLILNNYEYILFYRQRLIYL